MILGHYPIDLTDTNGRCWTHSFRQQKLVVSLEPLTYVKWGMLSSTSPLVVANGTCCRKTFRLIRRSMITFEAGACWGGLQPSEFASPPIQLGTNSRSVASDSPLFCDKAVHPLTDASCATPSFVTSTMRNRALPCIMRA